MNPMTPEMYEGSGDASSFLVLAGWFATLLLVYWLTGFLRLSHRLSLVVWASVNFVPLVWLAVQPGAQVLGLLGLLFVACFSYAIGASLFQKREHERRQRMEFEESEREDRV